VDYNSDAKFSIFRIILNFNNEFSMVWMTYSLLCRILTTAMCNRGENSRFLLDPAISIANLYIALETDGPSMRRNFWSRLYLHY